MTCDNGEPVPPAVTALIGAVRAASEQVRTEALLDLDAKAKPRGSLGRLEALAAHYAAATHDRRPSPPVFALVVAAADHGVAARGVSAYPAEVTAQMIAAIAGGGAAVSVLARQAAARLVVVDAGSAGGGPVPDGVLDARAQHGSGDICVEPAMSVHEAARLLGAGADLAAALHADGATAVGLGEMGIGNSTAAAALTALLLGAPAAAVTGRGTGVDDAALARKVGVVEDAVQRATAAGAHGGLPALCEVGGLEIAFLAGVVLGAAALRVPVILDGYISTSAALVAAALSPASATVLIASHRSTEPGHAVALAHLGLRPILDLELRLGEGSGAALAMPVVSAAVAILRDMATFDSAHVTDAGA